MALGIYISVPFCRTKCSYCNFTSDVFSRAMFDKYVDCVCADIASAEQVAAEMGGRIEQDVGSIYLGGGTPTVLESRQLQRMFEAVRGGFSVSPSAEVTVECAPGTLNPEMLDTLLRCGVNRVSLGVQSFVDAEAASVGRLHKRVTTLDDIARLRAAGITNINLDLIAGLPHQTAESWKLSLDETIGAGAPHVSVYMLEVDEDSRLGRELIAGGTRYHAHFVPDEEAVADFYIAACETLKAAGIAQYEISNFARPGFESRHNLKYWTRQPYLGFGVDAHSMLRSASAEIEAVRFATVDALEKFTAGVSQQRTVVLKQMALEETFFLGLRLNRGVDLRKVEQTFGSGALEEFRRAIAALISDGLVRVDGDSICLTPQGRLLSNEVFQLFIAAASVGGDQSI
ncbi:MAG TPA: radical SAM family heme chaperone HemW [Candidatus Sulfotelmatobacter sp.]|nr:radical SAM family heme chaperone HemW [Candidatus Sulfotelmatobacter sp.]